MEQHSIVIVGSLNMDLVVSTPRMPNIGETILGQEIHMIPGGKGANQAVGCSRLGAEATIIGAVGQDGFGEQILHQLKEYEVCEDRICCLETVMTGTATILHTPEDNCIVVVPGANGLCSPDMVFANEDRILSAQLLLVQLEVPLDTVLAALQVAHESGILTILNPAPARDLSKEMLRFVDYITPNETEFEQISGNTYDSDEELFKGMISWQRENTACLLVTRGSQGVSYVQDGELIHVPAPKVEVRDTTGAGDSFNAALGYGLASKYELEDAVKFAVKAASVSVTKFGAQAGMPTVAEILKA